MTDPIQAIEERWQSLQGHMIKYHPTEHQDVKTMCLQQIDIQNLLKLVKAIKEANNIMDESCGVMINIVDMEKEIFGEK